MGDIDDVIQELLQDNLGRMKANMHRLSVEAVKTMKYNTRVAVWLIQRKGSLTKPAAVAAALVEAKAAAAADAAADAAAEAAEADAAAEAAPVGPGEDSPAIRSPMPGGTRRRRRRSYRRRR